MQLQCRNTFFADVIIVINVGTKSLIPKSMVSNGVQMYLVGFPMTMII